VPYFEICPSKRELRFTFAGIVVNELDMNKERVKK